MKHILIIDDEHTFTELVKLNLEDAGPYRVTIENSSENAVKAVRQHKPDLILLDIVMPGKDGGDLAAELQTYEWSKDIPILFVTALLSPAEMKGGMTIERGGKTMIAKPVRTSTLIAAIESRFNGKHHGNHAI